MFSRYGILALIRVALWNTGMFNYHRPPSMSIFAVSVVLALVAPMAAQEQGVRRDAKAIEILTRAETVSAWRNSSNVSIQGTLAIHLSAGDKSDSFDLEMHGESDITMTSREEKLEHRGGSLRRTKDGLSATLPTYSQPSTFPYMLPFLSALRHWRNAECELRYEGTSEIDGESEDVVKLIPRNLGKLDRQLTPKLITQTVYFARTTGLPRRAIFTEPNLAYSYVTLPMSIDWKEYKAFGGVMLPTRTSKSIATRSLYTFSFSNAAISQ